MWLKNIKDKTHGAKSNCKDCDIPDCGCGESPSKKTDETAAYYKEVTNMEKKKDPYMEGAPDVGSISDIKADLATPFKLLDFMPVKNKSKIKVKTGKMKNSEINAGDGGSGVDDIMGAANKYSGRFS